MNNLCKSYIKFLNKKSNEIQIIFYGSNIYNESKSDLDVCIIVKNDLPFIEQKGLIEETKNFQKINNLKIDEEIPFENKLIYTVEDFEDLFINSPFQENGKYVYKDIVKDSIFLGSNYMKKRLLLNILTTDHKSYGNILNLKKYEREAWIEILTMIHEVFKTNLNDLNEVLENLYVNPVSYLAGEMYLGYKLLNKNKRRYLKKKANKYRKVVIKLLNKNKG